MTYSDGLFEQAAELVTQGWADLAHALAYPLSYYRALSRSKAMETARKNAEAHNRNTLALFDRLDGLAKRLDGIAKAR